MLRTNLSTRPFYNERAVHAIAAAVALIVLAVTAWEVVRIVRLSKYKTELNTAIRRDRNQADYLIKEPEQVMPAKPQGPIVVNGWTLEPLAVFTLDARVAHRFGQVEAFAAAENLTGERYAVGATPILTQGPPVLLRAGVRFDLR